MNSAAGVSANSEMARRVVGYSALLGLIFVCGLERDDTACVSQTAGGLT